MVQFPDFLPRNLRFVGATSSFLFFLFLVFVSEFAALILNTNSGLVESVFHNFVRPTHFPSLSDYCKSQTGFTQSFIDQQKTFSNVYNKFVSWLRQNIVKRSLVFATPQNCQRTPTLNAGLNATFCTWSDWDLGHYLYRDCIRNEISRYECMKTWIDIRRAFDVSNGDFVRLENHVCKGCMCDFVEILSQIFSSFLIDCLEYVQMFIESGIRKFSQK